MAPFFYDGLHVKYGLKLIEGAMPNCYFTSHAPPSSALMQSTEKNKGESGVAVFLLQARGALMNSSIGLEGCILWMPRFFFLFPDSVSGALSNLKQSYFIPDILPRMDIWSQGRIW